MRIYVFIERYPNPYKPYIDAQLVEFLRLGHEVEVFAGGAYRGTVHQEVLTHRLEEKTKYYPETLKDLPKYILTILFHLVRRPAAMTSRIRRCVKKDAPLKSRLMAIARMLVIPVQSPDICLIHNLSTVASFSFLPACYPESRVVMYFHGGEVGGTPRVTGAASLFNGVHAVFTNTRYSRDLAVSRGCRPEKVVVLPVGFSLADYAATPDRRYRPDGRLRIISVGRMGVEKGFHIALEAIKHLVFSGCVDFHYSIVGSGQQHAELKKFVEANQLHEYVTFMGELEKREVIQALAESDVLILPSLTTETWAETQACVVQEALLMGLVAVTTTTGGVPESIPPEMKIFSVAPGDARAIASRISEILSMNIPELARLGEVGRRFVVQNYDITKVTGQLLEKAKSM